MERGNFNWVLGEREASVRALEFGPYVQKNLYMRLCYGLVERGYFAHLFIDFQRTAIRSSINCGNVLMDLT